MARRPAPPPPPPPQPPSPASDDDDDGSSSGDEEEEQARYRLQMKPSNVPPPETIKSSAAAADDATSDGEEDEEGSEEEEEEEKLKGEEGSSEDDDEDDGDDDDDDEDEDEDEDEEGDEANNQVNNSQPPQASQKAPPPPESSSEADSGSSESNDETPLPPAPATASRPSRTKDLSIKPISSRPMVGSSTNPPASPPSHDKKPLKSNGEARNRSDVNSASVTPKKPMFQRIWSAEDELTVLRGMVDYRAKHSILPTHAQDMPGFLDFIKGSLGVEVNKDQLVNKIRKLKNKFMVSSKNGDNDPTFSNFHNKAVYDLSKIIWGSENTAPVLKLTEGEAELTAESDSDGSARVVNAEYPKNYSTFPYLSDFIMTMDDGNPSSFGIKRAFEHLDPGRAAFLERNVKKLKLKGMRLKLREMDLVKDSLKLVVDSLVALE